MKYGLIISAILVICLGGLAFHYYGRYVEVQDDISSQETVTSNVITTISLMQDIARATHDDKDAIALESQRAKTDIKASVTGYVCADSDVSTNAVNGLREYADSVRYRSTGIATR